jgi:two-component system KDP operon response regulator KdpE
MITGARARGALPPSGPDFAPTGRSMKLSFGDELGLGAETGATSKLSVLVVEDDRNIALVLSVALDAEGYRVLDAGTGQRAVAEVRTRNPDVVLLDLGLPDVDGLALVSEIRKNTTAPIIVVSARYEERSKIAALDSGANDYMTKPFSVVELRARIRAALRGQSHVGGTAETCVSFGAYTFDLLQRRLTHGGRQIRLSPTELKLLATLARHANELVTTQTLLQEAWGAAYKGRGGYVRVYMHSLRCKLERDPTRPKYLVNELGLGYRLQTRG